MYDKSFIVFCGVEFRLSGVSFYFELRWYNIHRAADMEAN